MNNTIKVGLQNVKMVAHRGVSGLEMENTASAFVAAGNRSHFGVECDIHVTADKHIVVIHDSSTKRVALEGKDITVEELTLDEIRKIRLKNLKGPVRGDLMIPTLAEYVGICKHYGKICVIELKDRFTTGDIKLVIEEIKSLEYLENVIFISFSWENMVDLRTILPDQPLQLLCGEVTDELIDRLNSYSMDVDIHHSALTKENIDLIHKNGHLINCWTVDDPERAKVLASWGVDYITSNILE